MADSRAQRLDARNKSTADKKPAQRKSQSSTQNERKPSENRFQPLQADDTSADGLDAAAFIEAALGALPDGGEARLANSTLGDIVTAVVQALVPIITAAVKCSAVSAPSVEKIKSNVQVNSFSVNSLEQYSRRENIKIVGLPEAEDEDTMEAVVNVINDAIKKKHLEQYPESAKSETEPNADTEASAGESDTHSGTPADTPTPLTISREDLSIAHRCPTRRGKIRPIVARFVRREVREHVMRNRGGLKGHPKGMIFIHDDLTKINDKMLWALRNDENVEKAYSINSVLWAITKPGTVARDSRKVKIESPDDLLQAGLSQEKIASLDLYHSY